MRRDCQRASGRETGSGAAGSGRPTAPVALHVLEACVRTRLHVHRQDGSGPTGKSPPVSFRSLLPRRLNATIVSIGSLVGIAALTSVVYGIATGKGPIGYVKLLVLS